MALLPAIELVGRAADGGYAVPAFCAWSSETVETALRTAAEREAPLIIMFGPAEFRLLPPVALIGIARALAARYDVPLALHLDHAGSRELVEECLQAGFTSVMLDYSSRPFEENVDGMRRVVERARLTGATVEGELGAVGRADTITDEGSAQAALTDPEQAAEFVRRTGVDMLAVAVGNAHGLYREPPSLDFDRIARLRAATGVPLVLHGGSGTPEEALRKAVSLGMAKVNVASELVHAVRTRLMELWQRGESMWMPIALSEAMKAYGQAIGRWLDMTGAEGKAADCFSS